MKWNKLKLVPSAQATCKKFNFTVTFLKIGKKWSLNLTWNFQISLAVYLLFFKIKR